MTMKANELMIGDWVYSAFSDIPCKVQLLELRESGYGSVKTTNVDGLKDIASLSPIPLTPEILEKNGFTHSFGDSDFYDYEKWEKKVDDKTIRVIKDHDGLFCRVDDNKLTRSMGIAPAVHTMQNIIRIGGIEKSIEL